MADAELNNINNGKTLQFSFEDFVLLPLFFVLAFLSLKICIKKLRRKRSNQQDKCASRGCIRCKGSSSFSKNELLAKLHQFAEQQKIHSEDLSRLRTSILYEGQKTDDVKTTNQFPTMLYLRHLTPAKPIHSVSYDASILLGTHFNITRIQEELIDVLNKDYLWSYNEVEDGIWKLYYFYNQGIKQTVNCDKCPQTARMISNTALFMNNVSFGNAAFSYISPGTIIPAHYGSTNARLRCHITLCQGNNCTLSVESEEVIYNEEQIIVFDDSFEHSVNHEKGGSNNRIILMLDLWHPEVSKVEREAIEYIYQFNN